MSDYPAAEKRQRAFDALSLEYNSLRDELVEKTERSDQTSTLLVAAAGALYALSSAKKDSTDSWLIGVAVALVVLAGLSWFSKRRTVGKISAHVAALEKEINDLVADGTTGRPFVDWETTHQQRPRFAGIGVGKPPQGRHQLGK